MLSKYVPEDISFLTGKRYLREGVLNGLEKQIIHRGTLSRTGDSYYVYDRITNERGKCLAATSIIADIDWDSLPEEHPYHRSRDGSVYDPDNWPLIQYYARRRGIILHHIILRDDIPDRTDTELDLFRESPPGDATQRDVQEVVSGWDKSTRVPHPDEIHLWESGAEALAKYSSEEALDARHNWDQINDRLETTRIADESLVINKTVDGYHYGGQIDRLTAVEDGPISRGVYVLDFKLSDDWHPSYLAQAEAYRRCLTDHIPDVEAAVVRLGIDDGDWDIISSHDDEWDSEELWNLFSRRAEGLYEDSLYQIALENSGR